jgi:hypothetical protein
MRVELPGVDLGETEPDQLTRLYARTANTIQIGTEIAIADLIARRHGAPIEIRREGGTAGGERPTLVVTILLPVKR